MSELAPNSGNVFSRATSDREAILESFEAAWSGGERPRIEDFLPSGDADSRLLAELAQTDLEYRLRKGEPARAEDYLARFPSLAADQEAVVELIAAEFRLGSSVDARPSVDEFLSRYPRYAAALRPRLVATAEKCVPGTDSTLEGPTPDGVAHASTIPPDPAARRMFVRPGGRHDERYRPLRFHDKGGIGEVHLAQDVELGREVALKRIQDHLAGNSEVRRRFLREAEVTARLQHPGIVPVYGLVEDADGQPCYAMRFIEGQSLKEAIEAFHGKVATALRDGDSDAAAALRDADSDTATVVRAVDSSTASNVVRGTHEVGRLRELPSGGTAADHSQLTTHHSATHSFASLEFRKLLNRFVDACNAIEYAHSRGVVHRDIKPANIMLGEYGETLVVDWGLAKVLGDRLQGTGDRGLEDGGMRENGDAENVGTPTGARDPTAGTQAGQLLGTPQYMSPEQADGRQDLVGLASDVYSLGATLYTLLTGKLPFRAQNQLEALDQVRRGEFVPVREAHAKVPRALAAVCAEAMSSDPADRYASARALADDVEHWLADEPVTSVRESRFERLARWGRKHRTWVRAGIAAALVVAAVLGVALVLVDRARRATDNALLAETKAKGVAEERETQAIDAVKRFGDAVANNPDLKNSLQLESLRKTLLKEPLAFFRELRDRLQTDNDSRSESLARLASASYHLGFLTNQVGDEQDALVAYRESLAVRQKLADDYPDVTQFQSDLAASHNNIGVLLRDTGKPTDALAAFESALAIRKKLADANPSVAQFQSDLAASHNNIGLLLSETGQPAEALAAYESALAIQQELADANPTLIEIQRELGVSHNNIGALLAETGKPAEALAAHKSALAIERKLSRDHPTVTQFQGDLARSHHNIGVLLQETGKRAEALAANESALAIRQKLAHDNPTVTQFQRELAATHNSIGVLMNEAGKPAEALAAYESALAIRQKLADDNPTVTHYQDGLAGSHNSIGVLLNEIGQPLEALAAYELALAILEKLTEAKPNVTEFQRDLAHTHYNIGDVLSHTGKPVEALAAYKSALAIRQKLADNNPTVTGFQNDLAISHNGIANVLSHTGKLAEALAANESALAIQQKLAGENPTVTMYQRNVAGTHNNIGNLLKDSGKPADALVAYQSALAIQQKLADDNPTITEYGSDLALSYGNIGVLLAVTGKPAESLAACQSALAIQQKLADENPTVIRFQSDLARSHYNIGCVLTSIGKPAEALTAYDSALGIWQKLAREHPESPDLASGLGKTLNNLAALDLDAKRFEDARGRLQQAIQWQRKALAASAANSVYRQALANHLNNLITAAQGLGDTEGVAEAERELAELRDTDPAFAALDARLTAIVKGEQQPSEVAERLALAQRAYDKALFATAGRLWVEALEANPALADDRQAQHRYNAACCAALAASGKVRDDPPPDDAAKGKLRQQALGWLKAELGAWTTLLATADEKQRGFIAQTLQHWQQDSDLAGIREPDALAQLPDDEGKALSELWTNVGALRQRAEAPPAEKAEP